MNVSSEIDPLGDIWRSLPNSLQKPMPGEVCPLFDTPGLTVNHREWMDVRRWMIDVEKRLLQLEKLRNG